MNNRIKKLYKYTNKQKKKNPDMYYFDDGSVCESKDYEKDGMKYSVIKVNTDLNTSNYLVYLLVIAKNKSIPQMLLKSFKTDRGTEKYFNELCSLIEKNSNQDIIEKCYDKEIGNTKNSLKFKNRLFG